MKPTPSKRSWPALMLAPVLIASLALAACGSSSSSSTSTLASAASTTKGAGPGAGRFEALRECLKKEGIELPQRKAGHTGTPGAGGGFFGGATPGTGFKLPNGVTRTQYEAALKKCGGGFRHGGFGARVSSAAYKKALASFVTCMAGNGVKLPVPNTSGKGPVFDTSKVDINTAQFKTAEAKCASLIRFARPGGAAGAGSGYAGPPSGAGAPPSGEGGAPPGEGTPPGA